MKLKHQMDEYDTTKGTLNIRAGEFQTIVTSIKGRTTLLLEGEEKKLLEGRQHR